MNICIKRNKTKQRQVEKLIRHHLPSVHKNKTKKYNKKH